jgi:DNA (cytosine-5)-methyltransferase 1
MPTPIPVIDLFAGPGGLGEGFSSIVGDDGKRTFNIKLSIEMDKWAHRTLELRKFFREFPVGQVPDDYYEYLALNITREELFGRHRNAAAKAANETWLAELGAATTTNYEIDGRIHKALGNRRNWVLIGGPPCQAYSLVGRSRVIGKKGGRKKYDADPRHKLYEHYLRILAVHQPPVFIMENVKGLLSAKVKEEQIFQRILADLKDPSAALPGSATNDVQYRLVPLFVRNGNLPGIYEPRDFVVCAEEHGIPQARHRIIILGIRSDVCGKPGILKETGTVTVRQTIGDLPRVRSGMSKEDDCPATWHDAVLALESARWMQNGALDRELRSTLKSTVKRVSVNLNRGAEFISCLSLPREHLNWYFDARLLGACNHETRCHIRADLHRYFFAAVYARKYGRSPLLENFPRALLPKHKNVSAALREAKFNDRFRVQLAERPSTTIVSHISKDGHYFIHYDPTQCRSLTVREAARLQTFPDNYRFEGPRTQQYKQVGNAVPPLLAMQIAEIVAEFLR